MLYIFHALLCLKLSRKILLTRNIPYILPDKSDGDINRLKEVTFKRMNT
jgi:hypothetical protein